MNKTALIIDHDDSFIWNIKAWLEPEFQVSILNHSENINHDQINLYDLIILSPGPKNPVDYPMSLNLLTEKIYKPVLGICLGFQMMTVASGGTVTAYSPPKHGKTSGITCHNKLFNNLQVARYHSLQCLISDNFEIIAYSTDDQIVMWDEIENQVVFLFCVQPTSLFDHHSCKL